MVILLKSLQRQQTVVNHVLFLNHKLIMYKYLEQVNCSCTTLFIKLLTKLGIINDLLGYKSVMQCWGGKMHFLFMYFKKHLESKACWKSCGGCNTHVWDAVA